MGRVAGNHLAIQKQLYKPFANQQNKYKKDIPGDFHLMR